MQVNSYSHTRRRCQRPSTLIIHKTIALSGLLGAGTTVVETRRMKRRMFFWVHLLLSLLLVSECFATPSPSDDMLEMKVKGVAMDPHGNTPIVVLEDAQGQHAFPIWIGLPEAQAIARAIEGTSTPRPMTHMLLQNILGDLQVEVARIIINDLQSNTFHASIFLRQGAKIVTVDARPSDAIALALGAHAPIFVTQKVLGAVRTVKLSVPAVPRQGTKKFGMHLQNLDEALAEAFHLSNTEGVLVAFVESGSQAGRHGIRRGDVITGVDGKAITNLPKLLEVLSTKTVGEDVMLQVWRDQAVHTIRMTLAVIE